VRSRDSGKGARYWALAPSTREKRVVREGVDMDFLRVSVPGSLYFADIGNHSFVLQLVIFITFTDL